MVIFSGNEQPVVLNYGSSRNTEPVVLKRVKRRRGGGWGRGGGSRRKSSGGSRSWNPFKSKKRPNPVPKNSYPKQPGHSGSGSSGFGRPPQAGWNVGKPAPAGWNIPPGAKSPQPTYSGGFPKVTPSVYGGQRSTFGGHGGGYGSLLGGGGYNRGGITSSLSRGGTGRSLGAGLLGGAAGGALGLYAGYQLGRMMSYPHMRSYPYQERSGFGFQEKHDHYHDEHGHYLGPDGLFYDHTSNRMAHDSRGYVPAGQTLEGFDGTLGVGAPLTNVSDPEGRLVRFYPYNATYGIFEYSNTSTVQKKFADEQTKYMHWVSSQNNEIITKHSVSLIMGMVALLLVAW